MTGETFDERVRSGAWPDPNLRRCADCGHVWFVGERRHVYVAPGGEVPAAPEGAEVLCILCLRERELGAA
jgi:hypothetical protein